MSQHPCCPTVKIQDSSWTFLVGDISRSGTRWGKAFHWLLPLITKQQWNPTRRLKGKFPGDIGTWREKTQVWVLGFFFLPPQYPSLGARDVCSPEMLPPKQSLFSVAQEPRRAQAIRQTLIPHTCLFSRKYSRKARAFSALNRQPCPLPSPSPPSPW